jgi:hypothetical protein
MWNRGERSSRKAAPAPPLLYQHLWRAWSEHSDQADPGVDWDAILHYLTRDRQSAARSATYTDDHHDRMLLLHFAVALSPPVSVVRRIIDLNPGAVVAGSGIGGLTPFMIACGRNAPQGVLRALLESDGRAVLRVDRSGFAPIHWSCRDNVDERVVKLILEVDPTQAERSVAYSADDEDDEEDDDDDDGALVMTHATRPLQMLAQQYKASCSATSPAWTRNQRKKAAFVLWARHYGSLTLARTSSMYSTLHAALALACARPSDIPAEVVDMAVRYHALDSSGVRDLQGNLPLHYAVSCRASVGDQGLVTASHVRKLLRAFPVAAQTRDLAGVLPLHRAIRSGRFWHSGGVKDVYQCHPGAAIVRDAREHLFPAFSAAVYTREIDTTFSLLRAYPEVVYKYRHRQAPSTPTY